MEPLFAYPAKIDVMHTAEPTAIPASSPTYTYVYIYLHIIYECIRFGSSFGIILNEKMKINRNDKMKLENI